MPGVSHSRIMKGGIDTYHRLLMETHRKLHAKLKPTGLIYCASRLHVCHT